MEGPGQTVGLLETTVTGRVVVLHQDHDVFRLDERVAPVIGYLYDLHDVPITEGGRAVTRPPSASGLRLGSRNLSGQGLASRDDSRVGETTL